MSKVPGLTELLGNLYGVLDVRRTVFPKLLGLQGRLDVMLSQVFVFECTVGSYGQCCLVG